MEQRAEYDTGEVAEPQPQRPHLYLMDEHVHQFYPTLAERIGLNEAIVIQQIHSWIVTYTKDPKRFQDQHWHDGRWWIWNSYPDWHEALPYFSESTIKRTLHNLRELGIVKTGNYNTLKIDRTLWYTIDYAAYDKLWSDQEVKTTPPSGQNDQMEKANLTSPLPSSSSLSSSSSFSADQESAAPSQSDTPAPPTSFEDWLDLGQKSTNKTAVLKRMHDTLFPGHEPPDYAYIGTVAKRVGGAGRLAQLLWEAAAKRPAGDVLAYIQATVRNKRNGNGRHDTGGGGIEEFLEIAAEYGEQERAAACGN